MRGSAGSEGERGEKKEIRINEWRGKRNIKKAEISIEKGES